MNRMLALGLLGVLCVMGLGLRAQGQTSDAMPAATVAPPAEETNEPTKVFVRVIMVDLEGIDSAEQNFAANIYMQFRWDDPREKHDGKRPLVKPLTAVWHPTIQIVNQQRVWKTFAENVVIYPDGQVIYRQRVWGYFSQPLDLRKFPLDKHTFHVSMVAAGSDASEVEILQDPNAPSMISETLSVPDWELLGFSLETYEQLEVIPGYIGPPGVVFSFRARRYVGYFLIQIIFPLILIVAMACMVFWIDPKQWGVQITISMTSMLTLIAYRFSIGASLPTISYLTRMDTFVFGSTVLVFLCLLEVVTTSSLAKGGHLKLARRMDKWCRVIFPLGFVLLTYYSFWLGIY